MGGSNRNRSDIDHLDVLNTNALSRVFNIKKRIIINNNKN